MHCLRSLSMRCVLTTLLALAGYLQPYTLPAQITPELSSLDSWIVQHYRGAQVLPDSNGRSMAGVMQAGAPRVESARTVNRRDTIVALHFGPAIWRPTLGAATRVQLADPTGAITGITGRVTARRAFRAPRLPGARDTIKAEWRIGWAYLVALPARSANAAASGFGGWAVQEALPPGTSRSAGRTVPAPQASFPATLPPIR